MLLKDFIRDGISGLVSVYPEPEARSIVLRLCEDVLGVRPYTHVLEPGYVVAAAMEPVLSDALRRLRAAEPIQYVLGHAEFCGRRFRVTPDVLIPRQETELLVEEAVAAAGTGDCRILDLCTGSGCIAWSVALARPCSHVTGVDISEAALAVACSQPFADEVANVPVFVRADVLADPSQVSGDSSFDLLLGNPPYVMESQKAQMHRNVLDHEPGLAIFVPDEDPLVFYRALSLWAKRLLVPGGRGIVEINDVCAERTSTMLADAGFADVTPIYDLSGAVRHLSFVKRL